MVCINDGDLILALAHMVDEKFRPCLTMSRSEMSSPPTSKATDWQTRFSSYCYGPNLGDGIINTAEPQVFYWNGKRNKEFFECIHINAVVDNLRSQSIPTSSLYMLSCFIGNDYVMKSAIPKKFAKKFAKHHQKEIDATPFKDHLFQGVSRDTAKTISEVSRWLAGTDVDTTTTTMARGSGTSTGGFTVILQAMDARTNTINRIKFFDTMHRVCREWGRAATATVDSF
jgi:hypothetical protein